MTDWSSESGLETTTASARGSPSAIRSRRAWPGSVKLQPTISSKPRSRIDVLGAAAQPLLAGQAADLAGAAGSVAGRCSSRPWMRPTSSIRSTSRVTS